MHASTPAMENATRPKALSLNGTMGSRGREKRALQIDDARLPSNARTDATGRPHTV